MDKLKNNNNNWTIVNLDHFQLELRNYVGLKKSMQSCIQERLSLLHIERDLHGVNIKIQKVRCIFSGHREVKINRKMF